MLGKEREGGSRQKVAPTAGNYNQLPKGLLASLLRGSKRMQY